MSAVAAEFTNRWGARPNWHPNACDGDILRLTGLDHGRAAET